MKINSDAAEKIHAASLRILENIGIRLEHEVILERLLKSGARPGRKAQEVRLPAQMIAECLAQAPTRVELAARDGSSTTLTSRSESVFWTNPALNFYDGKIHRKAFSQDLADIARLCDHLPTVQGVLGLSIQDVPPVCRDFTGLRIIAENCRRHIRVLCFSPKGMEALLEMKPVFPGNWFSIGFTAHGPLRWTNLALDIFLCSAGKGIPVTINGEPMAGVTGPVSLAGTAAVGNAEILAGIVVNQILEPGRPVIYNLGLAHVFDMKHAIAVTGGPENALLAGLSAVMGRFYNLPSSSWVSTEAAVEDEQAALEKIFGFHTHMAEGVGLIWGMGQLESEMTISPGQLVMDDEMIRYARHYQKGITVDDNTLVWDVIRETGIGGNYLESEHTLAHFREHLFEPRILFRQKRAGEVPTLAETAHNRARALIAGDTEEKISGEASKELRRLEQKYRKQLL